MNKSFFLKKIIWFYVNNNCSSNLLVLILQYDLTKAENKRDMLSSQLPVMQTFYF